MFCENCGKEIADDSRICGYCGIQIRQTVNQQGNVSQSSGRENDGKTVLPFKKKSNEIYFKNAKDLQSVVQLINEGNLAIRDSTKELGDCPMANAIYQARKEAGTDQNSEKQVKSLLGMVARGGLIAGAFVVSAPAAITGLGIGLSARLINASATKKQLHESKLNLLPVAITQVENMKSLRNTEKNATVGRKNLLEALEEGLTQAVTELQSDLDAEK